MQNTETSRKKKYVLVGEDVHLALKLQAAQQREPMESLADRILRDYFKANDAIAKQPQEALAS